MLHYRRNRHGFAILSGRCRVGHLRCYGRDRWHWQLRLSVPLGRYPAGIETNEQSAREKLEDNFFYWLHHAHLRELDT